MGTGSAHTRLIYILKCTLELWQAIKSVVELPTHFVKRIQMTRVTVYSTASCYYCGMAKTMLNRWGIAYNEIRIDDSDAARQDYIGKTNNARTIPQILIDGKLIGGFSELTELHMDGDLDELMQSN